MLNTILINLRESPKLLLAELQLSDHPFMSNPSTVQGLEDLKTLFDNLESMSSLENVRFDLSLARGLDYYTGLVTEAVLVGENVGSIAGGNKFYILVNLYTFRFIMYIIDNRSAWYISLRVLYNTLVYIGILWLIVRLRKFCKYLYTYTHKCNKIYLRLLI